MALSLEEVHRIAALARLELTAEESRLFARQLGEVVEFMARMERHGSADEVAAVRLPQAGVEAEDLPTPGLEIDQFLANAPRHRGSFLVVPRILDQETSPESSTVDG